MKWESKYWSAYLFVPVTMSLSLRQSSIVQENQDKGIVINLTITTFSFIESQFLEIDCISFFYFSQLATRLRCLFPTALAVLAPLHAQSPCSCPRITSFAAVLTGFSWFWDWRSPLCLIPPQPQTPTCRPGLVGPPQICLLLEL